MDLPELDLKVDFLGGMSPLQGSGTLSGYEWCFRSRYDECTFTVVLVAGLDETLNADGWTESYFGVIENYGAMGGNDASYMSVKVGLELIKKCAAQFQQEREMHDV